MGLENKPREGKGCSDGSNLRVHRAGAKATGGPTYQMGAQS